MRKPNSPRAVLGSAFHAGTAAFDKARAEGSPISVADAAGALADEIAERSRDTDWSHGDMTRREVETRARTMHTRYCTEWSPRYEFLAVERTVTPLTIDCGGGVQILLKGTLDRCRVARVEPITLRDPPPRARSLASAIRRIMDLKSGARIIGADGRVATRDHWPQVGIYELLEEHTSGEPVDEISEILGASTTGAPVIATGVVTRARERLVGVAGQFKGLIEYAAEMFRTGLFPPNPKSPLCSKRYCARWDTCPYHD